MESITWLSQEACLDYVTKHPATYVVSISDRHSCSTTTQKIRDTAKNLFVMNVNLDDLGTYIVDDLAKFILSLDAGDELVFHCTEGRYRSRYLVEAVQVAWGHVFDDFIEFNEVRSEYTHIHRDDVFSIVRPLIKAFEECFRKAKEDSDHSASRLLDAINANKEPGQE